MTDQAKTVPPELARSAPRPVRLTASGRLVACLGAALAVGAVAAFSVLLATAGSQRDRAAAFAARGQRADAEITSVRRADDSRRRVQYRYEVDGAVYGDTVRLRARAGHAVGGRLAVVYLPDRPADHYVEARGLRSMPVWIVPLVPALLLFGAALAWRALRCQRDLVENGRPVVAAVTGSKKQQHQYGSHFTVTYEFRLMNGSARKGSYQVQKNPPAPGTPVVVLHDRDRPERNKRYPISLVRVATGW